MSIDKITSSILAEAETAQKAALDEARAKCDRILEEAKQKARAQAEAMIEKGRDEKEKIILRRKSVAAIDSKKVLLEKKQEVIADCFDQVIERIVSLPRREYIDFLVRTGLMSDMPGGVVSFNEKEQAEIAPDILRRLNEESHLQSPEGKGDARTGDKFSLSPDPEPIDGGYWIRYGQTYADVTVGTLVKEKKKELAAEVSRMLFED